MLSSKIQNLKPACREDLQWSRHDNANWIVLDPLANVFYSFNDLEYFAVMLMNGQRSVSDILNQIRVSFPSTPISNRWLFSLLEKLRSCQLSAVTEMYSGRTLIEAGARRKSSQWKQTLLSPLSIQVPLFSPDPLLRLYRPLTYVLFHPLIVLLVLACSFVLFIGVLREVFAGQQLISFAIGSITFDRWLLLIICYIVSKSIHELSHALACVRYDVECREMGLLFLCFMPCFYCDTTDAWRLTSRWQRAVIGAAGMYAEIILASIAAAIWIGTHDGMLHSIAANMMIVCSVSTLLLNANPLLRYDGYYILSDLCGIPNLAEQSRDALRVLTDRIVFAGHRRPVQFDGNFWLLAGFAIVSSIYRTMILVAILWYLWSSLIPLGLGLAAMMVTGAMAIGMSLSAMNNIKSRTRRIRTSSYAQWGAMLVSFTTIAVVLWFIAIYPWPRYARGRFVTDYLSKQPVFATHQAQLLQTQIPNQKLGKGAVLLELESMDAQLELLEVRGKIAILDQDLVQLQMRRTLDPEAAFQIPAKQEILEELRKTESVLNAEIAALRPVAVTDGFLLDSNAHTLPPMASVQDDRFAASCFDRQCLGCYVQRGDVLAWFVPHRDLVVNVMVPERSIGQLAIGMSASLRWDSHVDEICKGTILRISPEPIRTTPNELLGDEFFVSVPRNVGGFEPETNHYLVTMQVFDVTDRQRGSVGVASIKLPTVHVYRQLVEYFQENFRLPR